MSVLTPARVAGAATLVGVALIALGLGVIWPPLGVIFVGVAVAGWGLLLVDVDKPEELSPAEARDRFLRRVRR
jgi:hypothetical protein